MAIRVGLTSLSTAIQAEEVSEEDLMMAVEAAKLAGIVGMSDSSEDAMAEAVRQITEAEQAAADETVRLFQAAYPPGVRVSSRAAWEAAVSEVQAMAEAAGPIPSNLDVWGMGINAAREAHEAAMAEAEETGASVHPPSTTDVWRMGLVAMHQAHVHAVADAVDKASMMDDTEEMAEMSPPSDLDVWRVGLVAMVSSVIASESGMAN
jgi:hypothetical protein